MLGRCVLAAAVAAATLAFMASSASAWRELEIEGRGRERIRQTSTGAITFREGEENFATCNITLNGTLSAGRLNNTLPRAIGRITRVEAERCELTATLGLPWTIMLTKVLPAAGGENGEAIPVANITGALLEFPEAGGRGGSGFSFRAPFGTCLYGGVLRTLFTIAAGAWRFLEILVMTTYTLVSGAGCEPTITLVGGFNPPEATQRLNFT